MVDSHTILKWVLGKQVFNVQHMFSGGEWKFICEHVLSRH